MEAQWGTTRQGQIESADPTCTLDEDHAPHTRDRHLDGDPVSIPPPDPEIKHL